MATLQSPVPPAYGARIPTENLGKFTANDCDDPTRPQRTNVKLQLLCPPKKSGVCVWSFPSFGWWEGEESNYPELSWERKELFSTKAHKYTCVVCFVMVCKGVLARKYTARKFGEISKKKENVPLAEGFGM